MLDYTTKAIDKKLNELKESFNGEEIDTIDVYELLRKEENYINKYHDLMMIYAGYAAGFLLVYNDTYRYKGYCYLAAQVGKVLSDLYTKGLRADGWRCSFNEVLRNRGTISYYVKYAVLANDWDLAVRIATEDSLFGSILTKNYERAKAFLPDNIEKIKNEDDKQLMWSIVYRNEKKFNKCLEKRIKELRYYAKARVSDVECLDDIGLTMIKLAKDRGMNCTINVIELPVHLLDDSPVNKEKWKLPKDDELGKCSTC